MFEGGVGGFAVCGFALRKCNGRGQMRAIGKKRRGKELISNVYGRYTQANNTVYPEGSELVPIEPKSGREYGSPCIY